MYRIAGDRLPAGTNAIKLDDPKIMQIVLSRYLQSFGRTSQ